MGLFCFFFGLQEEVQNLSQAIENLLAREKQARNVWLITILKN
jgi:hypothetical protein